MFDVQTEGYLHVCNSGGQKVLGLPSDISKISNLLPPTPGQTMKVKQNGRKRVLFGGASLQREGEMKG